MEGGVKGEEGGCGANSRNKEKKSDMNQEDLLACIDSFRSNGTGGFAYTYTTHSHPYPFVITMGP